MAWLANLFKRRRPMPRQYHIILPDGTERHFDLEPRATVSQLLEVSLLSMSVPAVHHEIFGITAPPRDEDEGQARKWLKLEKTLKKELKGYTSSSTTLHLQVFFYPREHYTVMNRIAKHLIYCQVRSDLQEGRLKCPGEVSVQLAGLVAQAELGDYSRHALQNDYITQLRVVEMSPRHERQAVELHKEKRGWPKNECIDEFLSITESLAGYGALQFEAQDDQERNLTLGLGPNGVEVIMGSIQTLSMQWEYITTVNVRHRWLTFHCESAYNLTQVAHSFRCVSSKTCSRIAIVAVSMRNYYCNSQVADAPSTLRRFFSARVRRPKAQRGVERATSSVSSASAPARYRQSNHTSHDSSPQTTPQCKVPARNHAPALRHQGNHIHNISSSSLNAPLIHTDRADSISPNSAADSPTVVPAVTPESPSIRLHQEQKQPVNVKPKASTLPPRMDPADIMKVGAVSNGYTKYQLRPNPNTDNLDCIKELLDDNLANTYRSQPQPTTEQLSQQSQQRPHESGARYRRRSRDNINNYNKYQFDDTDYTHRSQTLQYRKSKPAYKNTYNYYHRPSGSEPSEHYLSTGGLHRSGSASRTEGVATMAHMVSLATLSQDSAHIDPHIRSLVFDSSQTDPATEL